MTVSIITFANLGKKNSISTPDILPVVEKFYKEKLLSQVICYTNWNFHFKNTSSAIPLLLHYFFRILEKYFSIYLPRSWYESIFDFNAQFKLEQSNLVFFHGGHFLSRTLRKAKSFNSITVDIPRLAHVLTNSSLEKEEMCLLGISDYPLYHSKLKDKYNHSNDFDYIIATSEFMKNSYINSGFPADKIFVASLDISTQRFMFQPRKDNVFRVLYTAYTTPLKGLHYLLKAWEELNLPNSELILVGGYGGVPDKLRGRYEEVIKRVKNIKTYEHTETPEEYYKNASLFVFPSLTESFGRVTLEAMACGLPVITTKNARGIVEDGKTGFVVPIRDPQAIKEKIEYLYHNPEARERMGKEARIAVENKKPFGEAVYEIYEEIMRREGKLK